MKTPIYSMLSRLNRDLIQRVPGSRYVTLWIFFALLMVLFPFVHGELGAIFFTLLFSLILISSVLTVGASKDARIGGLLLLVLAVGFRWAYFFLGGSILNGLAYLFAVLTLTFVSFLLFLALFKTKEVTSETIWQAVSVYILLGLTWASLFGLVETIAPGSFQDSVFPTINMDYTTLVYFSFVTLATLGYGDILPATQETRGLIIIEVLMGVLYMAILISRLVGTWKPGEEKKD